MTSKGARVGVDKETYVDYSKQTHHIPQVKYTT